MFLSLDYLSVTNLFAQSLEDIQDVVKSSGGALPGLRESKAAQRLSRKVRKMIEQMDVSAHDLSARKDALLDGIKVKEGKVQQSPELEKDEAARKQMLDQISAEK